MPLSLEDFISPADVLGATAAFFDGEIELDPASSDYANTIVGANKYFTWQDNGLAQTWRASTIYLFPPRDKLNSAEQPPNSMLFEKKHRFCKSAQRIWLEKCFLEYKKQNFDEGIIFLTSADVALRVAQQIKFDFPLCVMRDRPLLLHESPSDTHKNLSPRCLGFIYYLPSALNMERNIIKFKETFDSLGRVYH